jgi:LacI family transcriptional regulator
MPYRVTLDRIAKLAGVSKAAVSYVLSGREREYRIAEETAKRIREIASEMEYIPNRAAALLRKGRHRLIALIAPHVADFYAGLVSAIEGEAEQRDYQMLLGSTFDSIERERTYLMSLIARRVEGVIILPVDIHQPHLDILTKRRIPTVFFRRRADSEASHLFMTFDDFEVGRLAAKHLVSRGCRRLLFVSAPAFMDYDYLRIIHQARFSGYAEALQGCGYPSSEKAFLLNFENHAVCGELIQIISSKEIDGLVCLSDEVAAQTLQVLRRANIAVPGQVRVVGCDDSLIARYTSPPLTSLRLPKGELGKAMVESLFQMIDEEKQESGEKLFSPCLVERESTA